MRDLNKKKLRNIWKNKRNFHKNLLKNVATSKKLNYHLVIPRLRTNLISKIRKTLEWKEISRKILKVMMKKEKMREKMKEKTLKAKKEVKNQRKRRREAYLQR